MDCCFWSKKWGVHVGRIPTLWCFSPVRVIRSSFQEFLPFLEMVGCWTDKQVLLMVLLMSFPIFFSVLFLVTARHLGVHFWEGWICRGSSPNTSINVHKTKCWPNLLVLLPRLYIFNSIVYSGSTWKNWKVFPLSICFITLVIMSPGFPGYSIYKWVN